jgi:hypothetical protein
LGEASVVEGLSGGERTLIAPVMSCISMVVVAGVCRAVRATYHFSWLHLV